MKIKSLWGKKVVKTESEFEFQVVYCILESIAEIDNVAAVVYGIQIEKMDFEKNHILVSESIYDITPCKLEIEKFANMLLAGEVEPENLLEIVIDYIDSCEYMAV